MTLRLLNLRPAISRGRARKGAGMVEDEITNPRARCIQPQTLQRDGEFPIRDNDFIHVR